MPTISRIEKITSLEILAKQGEIMGFKDSLATKVNETKAAETTGTFEVLPAGIYTAKVTKLGFYTNAFNSESLHIEIEIDNGEENPRVIKVDKGFTLKDGSDNLNTLSTLKETLAACGIKAEDETTACVFKAFGKDVQGEEWAGAKGKEVSAFVRAVNDMNKTSFQDSNTVENIFKLDGTNSDGADQKEKFLAKIEKSPVIIKAVKAKATVGTAGAAQNASAAAARI